MHCGANFASENYSNQNALIKRIVNSLYVQIHIQVALIQKCKKYNLDGPHDFIIGFNLY